MSEVNDSIADVIGQWPAVDKHAAELVHASVTWKRVSRGYSQSWLRPFLLKVSGNSTSPPRETLFFSCPDKMLYNKSKVYGFGDNGTESNFRPTNPSSHR